MRSLPPALAPFAAFNQFIIYKLVPSIARPGKTDKLPVDYRTGQVTQKGEGGAHDPNIWMGIDHALTILPQYGRDHGIGFVFTVRDPFWFLDIDHCLIDGQWSPMAQWLLAALPGVAVEVSSSGNGLHAFGSGIVPPHGTRCKEHGLEFYTDGRFVALTGIDARGNAATDLSERMPWFVQTLFPPSEAHATSQEWTSEPCPEWNGPTDDADLIRRAMVPKAGLADISGKARFPDLWNCNVEALALTYPPDPNSDDAYGASEADAALAAQLAFWTGRNCERVKTLLLQSGLARPKHERDDYIERTILRACAICHNVLTDPRVETPRAIPLARKELTPEVRVDATFLKVHELPDLFKDCVYIQDNNGVMLPNGDIVDQSRFNARYGGRSFCLDKDNDRTSKVAFEAFLQNQYVRFPYVDGTVFRPDLPPRTSVIRHEREWVNVYRKPAVDRCHGDVAPFQDLLKRLLPKGDDALILLCFMAAIVQYPGKKFRWTVFLQGTEGNGKSLLVRCLRYALGHRYIINVTGGMIKNDFNGWLENHVLYVADDISTLGDSEDTMLRFRSLITEEDHPITYKGIDSLSKTICGNWIILDNKKGTVKISQDTRRFATLYCAQQSAAKRDADGLSERYFVDSLIPWLENGGFSYVAEYLATLTIDPRYNPGAGCQIAPKTSATVEAIDDGRSTLEADILEWIELDEPGFSGGFVSATMLTRRLDKPPTRLRMKEVLGRLGFESLGRPLASVNPDVTRPIIYGLPGKRLEDYEAAQLRATTKGMSQ